ncbi:fungal-specific transcription factor domain-containing protein [Xylariomycetidae sp. FL2044]|nr:fungal-specific transcription factor domain-containing protein [Xylariomycetidae sp. FL2044]
MPRRKAHEESAVIHRRTRTGCTPCLRRKVKCDGAKPQCRNCMTRSLTCCHEIQLKWLAEFEIRGKAFGRQGVWSKKSPGRTPTGQKASSDADGALPEWCRIPRIGPRHFLNTLSSDFHNESGDFQHVQYAAGSGKGETRASMHLHSLILSPVYAHAAIIRNPPVVPTYVDAHSSLMNYYINRICPMTTASRTFDSPFAHLIIPLAITPGQEDTMHSILALSAYHRSLSDNHWAPMALSFKGRVLTALRRRLNPSSTQFHPRHDPGTLVIMMFLCLFEILDNCDQRWVIHLKASQDIISGMVNDESNSSGLASFTKRFFAFQDVISRTACGSAAVSDVDHWRSSPDYHQVDPWMGCSPELSSIICGITNLGRAKWTAGLSKRQVAERAEALKRKLETLKLGRQSTADEALSLSAELKRQSALLYCHCALYDASPTTPEVIDLVREILTRVRNLIKLDCACGLTFPIFMAAVELGPADEELFRDEDSGESIHGRRFVLETLDSIASRSLCNISRTRAVILKIWRLRDIMDTDGAPPLPQTGAAKVGPLNDWNTYVGPHSSNISLA